MPFLIGTGHALRTSCIDQYLLQNIRGTSPVWFTLPSKSVHTNITFLHRSVSLARIAPLPVARHSALPLCLCYVDVFVVPILRNMVTKAAGGLGRRQLLTRPEIFIPLPRDFGSYDLFAGLPRTEWGLCPSLLPPFAYLPLSVTTLQAYRNPFRSSGISSSWLVNTMNNPQNFIFFCEQEQLQKTCNSR